MPSAEINLSTARQLIGLAGWILITAVFTAIGTLSSASAGGFYLDLVRPTWAPPAWLFGPAWTTLYILMAIAAWLVWRVHGFKRARIALSLFFIQLAVNALWPWLFFVWHLGAISFAEILILWVLIVITINAFWRLQKLAAVLLFPYLAWVSFASVLAISTWKLNPAILG